MNILAPNLRRLGVSRSFGHPAEQPVEAYVKCVSHVAQPVKWKMNCSYVEVPASI